MTHYKSEADRNVRRAFIENCRDMGRGDHYDVRHLAERRWWHHALNALKFFGFLGLCFLIAMLAFNRCG